MVLGLPLNVKDLVVNGYVAQFGGKILSPSELIINKSGLWNLKKSGDRRYKADFTNQFLPMGTYHLVAGKKVRFVYPGNHRTCARCHRAAEKCPGKGFANACRDNNGPMILISAHINEMMTKIKEILLENRTNTFRPKLMPIPLSLHTRIPCST